MEISNDAGTTAALVRTGTSPDDRRLAFAVADTSGNRLVTVGASGRTARTIDTAQGRKLFTRCWFDDGRIARMTTNGQRLLGTRNKRGATVSEVFRAPRGWISSS